MVSGLKGKIQSQILKNVKVYFETPELSIFYFKPQKWIPGKILILLDPQNLSVPQNLPFLDLPKKAIGNGNGKYGNAFAI